MLLGICGATKLVAHLLATTALFESRHLSKIQNGRRKQRSGQHTLARKIYRIQKNNIPVELYSSWGHREYFMKNVRHYLGKLNFFPRYWVRYQYPSLILVLIYIQIPIKDESVIPDPWIASTFFIIYVGHSKTVKDIILGFRWTISQFHEHFVIPPVLVSLSVSLP